MKIDIRNLSENQIINFFEEKGFDSYRGDNSMSGYGKNLLILLMI